MRHMCTFALLFIFACSSPVSSGSGSSGDGVSASDTGDSSDTSGNGDTSGEVSTVPRNPKCGPFDDGTSGKKHAWSGYSADNFTFTCNTCRGGYASLKGTWRFIDFKTEDPATDLQGYAETLQFDGNSWRNHLKGKDNNVQTDATVDGWYFCGDAVEMPVSKMAHEVLVVENAVPNGAFGNTIGDAYGVSIKTSTVNSDLIAIGLYDAIDGKYLYENSYCRIGSTIKGHPCSDPFAP